MKRLLRVAGALTCAVVSFAPALAQTTQPTAANEKMSGFKITTGYVTFTPVDIYSIPIPFADGTGAANGPTAFECKITNGAIGGMLQQDGTFSGTCLVPDATMTVPANINYQITVVDTSTGLLTSGKSYTLQGVQGVSGATWALDHYGPPAKTTNVQPMQTAYGPTTPTSCIPPSVFSNSTNSAYYHCVSGVFVQVAGTGGSSVVLQTNGVANAIQSTLNIKPGTNITVVPDSSGGVTINSTASGGSSVALQTNGTANANQTTLNFKSGTNVTVTSDGAGGVTVDAPAVGNEVTRATTAEGTLTTNLANEVTNRTTAVNLATAGAISGILPSAGTVIADYQLKDNAGTAPVDSSGNGNTGAFPGSTANPTWYAGGITLSGGQYFNSAGTTNAKTIMVQYCMNYRTSGPSPIAPQFDALFGNNNIAGIIFDSQSYQYGYSPALSVNGAPQTTWTGGSLTGCHNLIATLGTSGTNQDAIYLDGLPVATGGATTFSKSTGIYACGGASSGYITYLNGSMQRCTFWSTYLTASQALQAASLARTQAITQGNSFGVNAPITTVSQIAATGDSLTNGEGVTPYTSSLSTNVPFTVSNFGIGNITTYLIYPMLATREASVYAPQAPWNIDLYWAGTNDYSTGGKTPASAMANVLASCRQLKALGFKTIVADSIDRTTQSANVETFASLMRAQALTQCDGFVDLTAVPLLGASGANANTTYFQVDGVHLTAAGQVLVAGYMSNAVNALTGSSPLACDPALVTSATYASTAADGCKVFNAASNAIVDTLPSALGYTGRVIKRCNNTTSGSNTVTIAAPSDYPFNNVAGSTASVIAAGACQSYKASVVSTTAGGDYWQTLDTVTTGVVTQPQLSSVYQYGTFYGFGDSTESVVSGLGATGPANTQFSILANDQLGPAYDFALGGNTMEQIANQEYLNFVPPATTPNALPKIYMVAGINNYIANGNTTGAINNYQLALDAAISWAEIPAANRVLSTSATQTSGTWTATATGAAFNAAALPSASLQSTVSGSVLTFPITSNGKVGIQYGVFNSGGGPFTVGIGGVLQMDICSGTTTFTASGCNGVALAGATSTDFRQEFPIAAGATSVVVTTTSTGIVLIRGVDTNPTTNVGQPLFIMSGVLRQQADGQSAITAAFNAAALAVVNAKIADNLQVVFADMRTGNPGVNITTDMALNALYLPNPGGAPPYHPNNGGYFHAAQTVENAVAAAGFSIFFPNLGKPNNCSYNGSCVVGGAVQANPISALPQTSGLLNFWQTNATAIPSASSTVPGLLTGGGVNPSTGVPGSLGGGNYTGTAWGWDNTFGFTNAFFSNYGASILNCPKPFTTWAACTTGAHWDPAGNLLNKGMIEATISTVASAATVTITSPFVNVTGTATLSTLTVVGVSASVGSCTKLYGPSSGTGFSWATGGNILTAGGPIAANTWVDACYNGTGYVIK